MGFLSSAASFILSWFMNRESVYLDLSSRKLSLPVRLTYQIHPAKDKKAESFYQLSISVK
jgi:hypothetical protein